MFHRYPEPGWLTFFATLFLAEHLEQAGYEVYVGREILGTEKLMDAPKEEEIRRFERAALERCPEFAEKWLLRMQDETGVVAILDTKRAGWTRAYRFDMDALFVKESEDGQRLPNREHFCSENGGISHACGHDGHMAIGLALAEKIAFEKESLNGKYIFVFQPAEEGVRGAFAFCHQWRFGRIDRLICCHIGFAPENTFVAGAKGFLATTKFDVEFFGKSAHAGLAPERGKNALLAAAEAVVRMQEIRCPMPGVTRLNVGQFQAGESRNTIPAHAWIQVETRGENGALDTYMKEATLACIREACEHYQARFEVIWQGASVSASSDPVFAQEILECAERTGGFDRYLLTLDFGASDDGAVFMDMVQKQGGQAAYLLFGTKTRGLHHEAVFDFDESVLEKAWKVLYETARIR